MRVAILGGPGSGKGTQAKLLAEKYRVPQISTGNLLREAVKNDKNLDKEVNIAMSEGRLVDDQIVSRLLEDRLRKKDTKRGFIIDGYPRNIPQAQSLDALLGMLGRALQVAVNINADDDILAKRVLGRIGCADCNRVFNSFYSPPSVKNKCDFCGGKLVSRNDDTPKTIQVRIDVYHQDTSPLIAYYRAQHKLRTLSGMGSIDEIHGKLCDLVDLEIRPLEVRTIEIAPDNSDEEDSTIIAGGQINRVVVEKRSKKSKPKKKILTQKLAEADKPKVRKKRAANKPKVEKEVVAKTARVKKTKAEKAVEAKPVSKKKVSKKSTKKKPASKKASDAKKPVSKKVSKKTASKVTAKKTTKKKAVAKKAATKKTPAKKATTKKVAKKAVAKKAANKKALAKKTPSKKATKKKSSKKVAGKKTVSKKPAKKKAKKK